MGSKKIEKEIILKDGKEFADTIDTPVVKMSMEITNFSDTLSREMEEAFNFLFEKFHCLVRDIENKKC